MWVDSYPKGQYVAEVNETFKLIQHGEVYTPEPIGAADLLLVNDKIVKLGRIDISALSALEIDLEIIDAQNCVVIPGLIDPHEHIIGAGGEEGFRSRMPEIMLSQVVCAGITTVVGLLGTDTSTRHLECLHAKASQFCDEGITAFMYTGGFELPPSTLLGAPIDDIVMIDKIIGTGEVAISDSRYVDPEPHQLAIIVTQTMLGGKMGGKAGVTHFHVGSGKGRLSLLTQLIDDYEVPARYLYPTHVTRTRELMDDAIKLAKRGCHVDTDTIEDTLAECWRYYHENGGPPEKFTISSDAHTPGGSPSHHYQHFVECVRDHQIPLEAMLPCVTVNPAEVLQLKGKGRLQAQMDADVVILNKKSLEIVHVIAKGRHFVKDGQLILKSKQEEQVEAAQ